MAKWPLCIRANSENFTSSHGRMLKTGWPEEMEKFLHRCNARKEKPHQKWIGPRTYRIRWRCAHGRGLRYYCFHFTGLCVDMVKCPEAERKAHVDRRGGYSVFTDACQFHRGFEHSNAEMESRRCRCCVRRRFIRRGRQYPERPGGCKTLS